MRQARSPAGASSSGRPPVGRVIRSPIRVSTVATRSPYPAPHVYAYGRGDAHLRRANLPHYRAEPAGRQGEVGSPGKVMSRSKMTTLSPSNHCFTMIPLPDDTDPESYRHWLTLATGAKSPSTV